MIRRDERKSDRGEGDRVRCWKEEGKDRKREKMDREKRKEMRRGEKK